MGRVPPSVEDKYEILEKISEGGMGAVYKVRHRFLGRVRVIKVMRPHLVADAAMRKRFVREARLAGNLRHPNIAQVYDFAMARNGEAYLAMEYIDGFNLGEIHRACILPSVAFVLEVACQVLDALAYLHGKGIIHRDLSPDNIMVTRDDGGAPLAKLIDLGIAKLVEADSTLTAAGSFIGKVRYASPEWFRKELRDTADQRSDIYSFGVVLYELLTGRHPFGERDVSGFIAGHLFHDPEPFSVSDPEGRIPAELRALIRETLAKSPDERPPSAEVLGRELDLIRRRMEIPEGEVDELFRTCCQAARDRAQQEERLAGEGETDIRELLASIEDTPVTAPPPFVPRPELTREEQEEGRTELLSQEAPATAEGKPRRKILLAAAAAVLALVAVVSILVLGPGPRSQEPVPPGTLVVDAVPWAEVQSVTDGTGRVVPLPEDAATPLRLELPPGTYTVRLSHPPGPARAMQLTVGPGQVVSRSETFRTVSGEDFLASVGLEAAQK